MLFQIKLNFNLFQLKLVEIHIPKRGHFSVGRKGIATFVRRGSRAPGLGGHTRAAFPGVSRYKKAPKQSSEAVLKTNLPKIRSQYRP